MSQGSSRSCLLEEGSVSLNTVGRRGLNQMPGLVEACRTLDGSVELLWEQRALSRLGTVGLRQVPGVVEAC